VIGFSETTVHILSARRYIPEDGKANIINAEYRTVVNHAKTIYHITVVARPNTI
jgi:hypothetical protein